MKYNVIKIIISLMVLLCFGEQYDVPISSHAAKLVRAPKVEPKPIVGNYDRGLKPLPPPKTGYDEHVISSIPDFRSTAGSAGKNIVFAEDGQNVAVIYGLFSGDSTNFQQVFVSYSTNRGTDWIRYGPLSTYISRRAYSGLDAEPDWSINDMRVHYVWQQAHQTQGYYDSSPCFYAKEVSYPDGLITGALSLTNSSIWDVWFPCIGAKYSIVVITGEDGGQFSVHDGYIWRSTDYGETWDNGRLFFPGPLEWMGGPHFRFSSDGYIFFLWNRQEESNPSDYWPYYCESFDHGLTWTDPQLIWQGTPPYSDMSHVTGWWYDYDCEEVIDTPVVTLKLSTEGNDYGEIWVYRPNGGCPGDWHFVGTKLVGGDSTAPLPLARYPTVAADDRENIYVGYQSLFILSEDTVWECGLLERPYHQNYWYDWGQCTFNGNTIEEGYLEFAHHALWEENPPYPDKPIVAMIYNDAGDYPNTGNLYFDCFTPSEITETPPISAEIFNISVSPNPFRNSVKFTLPPLLGKTKLSIFDATGKLVTSHQSQVSSNCFVWDGRKSNGSLADPGVYFYNISPSNRSYQGKVILTR